MSIFAGVNLFETTRAGVQTRNGVSQPWSNEPTGVGYNSATHHLLVSDDSKRDVFDVGAGPDTRFGSSDDVVTSFDTLGAGNDDPEDVTWDPVTGSVWTIDGLNTQVFRYRPGPDGRSRDGGRPAQQLRRRVLRRRGPRGHRLRLRPRHPGRPGRPVRQDLRARPQRRPAQHHQHDCGQHPRSSRHRDRARLGEPGRPQLLHRRSRDRQRQPPGRERRQALRARRHAPSRGRGHQPAACRLSGSRHDGDPAGVGEPRR